MLFSMAGLWEWQLVWWRVCCDKTLDAPVIEQDRLALLGVTRSQRQNQTVGVDVCCVFEPHLFSYLIYLFSA